MKSKNNRITRARILVALLMLAAMLVQIPMQVLAQTDVLAVSEDALDILPSIPAKDRNFKLASNHDAILYGDQGENINISNGNLYFTVFENGKAQIKAVDLESRKVSTILSAGKEQIRNFYIVNDDTMLYLAGGVVYSCRIGAQKAERISPMDNVFSFIPTNSGNLYAAGELFDLSISLDNVHLLDKVSYYSVDLEKDHFVATVDGTLLQIPMAKLRGFHSKAVKNGKVKNADLLPYMTEYDLYGTYDTVELFGLNDENRSCEHCESEEPHTHREESLSEAELKGVGAYATVPRSNVGKMIMSQSDSLTKYTWTPKERVRKYNSKTTLSSYYFEKGSTVTGIPYAREAVFSNFASSLAPYVKYIVYGYNQPNMNEAWRDNKKLSFENFKEWISNPNSKFYGEAANIAPLYGLECSGFVSYCWGVMTKLGSPDFGSSTGANYCTALNVTNQSTLGMLQVGDAFVRSGDHVIMISNITVDSTGKVTQLEVTEETPPKTKISPWTADKFVSEYLSGSKPYIAYRPKTYKVTFVDDRASSTPVPMYVIANVPYSAGNGLPVQSVSGYQFLGWYTAASGGVRVTDSDCSGMSNRTLYARYRYTGVISPMSPGIYDRIVPQAVRLAESEER